MIHATPSAALLANGPSENIQRATALARLASAPGHKKMTEAELNTVSQDFESMFLAQMLSTMFGESTGSSLFGSNESKEVYKNLMVTEYGKTIAKTGGIGIASFIKRELIKMQEIAA